MVLFRERLKGFRVPCGGGAQHCGLRVGGWGLAHHPVPAQCETGPCGPAGRHSSLKQLRPQLLKFLGHQKFHTSSNQLGASCKGFWEPLAGSRNEVFPPHQELPAR